MTFTLITLFAGFDAASIFQWVVENASYLLIFLLMAVESSFIPFPSEVVVPPAAFLSAQTATSLVYKGQTISVADLNIWLIILVATAGALVGALVNYYLSVWIGRPLVYKFADSRIGHACLIDREKVNKAEDYFDSHGAISTFIGRLIPAVRQLISIPAGLARMNVGKFCLFTSLGALLWNAILAALGFWLGKSVSIDGLFLQVEKYNSYLTYIGLGIGVICLAIILFNAFRPKAPQSSIQE
ncbi:MAG: DedA family protein [Pseudoflavonifractor sp.]|nr:DedA family protein [Alloprevotella sp.]MCM1116713.1 DedA family protein [Pseudoflavonifractor sp.]